MSGSANRPLTPGRLALWGIEAIAAGIGVAAIYVIVAVAFSNSARPSWLVLIAWVFWAVGALLLVAAGVAKVIAIGVRSGRD